MPVITIITSIHAPQERCYDLSRSIDLHKASMDHTGERAIAGRTSGLICQGETVTWSAVHFGIRQELEVRITEMRRPDYFRDEMLRGAFRSFRHEHIFTHTDGVTEMKDVFDFESPMGPLGWLANVLFLSTYMKRLLTQRNGVIKQYAESDSWRQIIPHL